MKLYDGGRAPNPRRVRIFFAEKGVPLPELVPVDIGKREHKSEAFTRLNPSQRLPVLVLDDGTALAETVAICRYIESLHPQPPLFGRDAREQALVEMWNRRIELGLFSAVAAIFRHSHPSMAELEMQVPEWAEANREQIDDHLWLLELQLAGNRFLCGEDLTVADITAGIAIDFMKPSRIPLPEDFVQIRRWHAELSARPSWKA
ncbi:MAG: glutathione S-transferase family protein [Bosea sp. (in: a-proteobacteria)]|uniref:glutathione S-transferase family protein n=1 Tax=Bosea sp. (in: a-proteobacteria) TaxID=1871050 RepID=UPI002732FADF|nr:glutathione S-transferase family protein [Bosea sp. (in: a-proteobacteria)]MDP3256046.1 glutathione S-transferase family protein [Bosea sp. (in: a-proteobacteria)]MDP3318540.1 glutathione S-transferase family protein [Bosea sp. (in: a-proteobacteria)]